MNGDIDGEFENFQAFVDWGDDEGMKAQRQQWIGSLRGRENPFTPEVLERLRNE